MRKIMKKSKSIAFSILITITMLVSGVTNAAPPPNGLYSFFSGSILYNDGVSHPHSRTAMGHTLAQCTNDLARQKAQLLLTPGALMSFLTVTYCKRSKYNKNYTVFLSVHSDADNTNATIGTLEAEYSIDEYRQEKNKLLSSFEQRTSEKIEHAKLSQDSISIDAIVENLEIISAIEYDAQIEKLNREYRIEEFREAAEKIFDDAEFEHFYREANQ
jgi:hypothetical protein